MSDSEGESEPEIRKLPERSTRGNRLKDVADEMNPDDKQFYETLFGDDGSSTEEDFEESESEASVADSDFETSTDEEEVAEELLEEPRRKKRKTGYKEPGIRSKIKASGPRVKRPPRVIKKQISIGKRSLRETTQISSEVAEDGRKREEDELLLKRAMRRKRGRKVSRPVVMSQEEFAHDVVATEFANKQSLEALLKMEEKKTKRRVKKPKATGPMIRYVSRGPTSKSGPAETFISYQDESHMPAKAVLELGDADKADEIIANVPSDREHPRQRICAYSKTAAKYIDPETGTAYSTLEAFKQIRTEAQNEKLGKEEHQANRRLRHLHRLLGDAVPNSDDDKG